MKRLLFSLFFTATGIAIHCQPSLMPGDYSHNIVEMTNEEYGFIIGTSGEECYYIIIRKKGSTLPTTFFQTYIHGSPLLKRPSEKIEEFSISADYVMGLYKMKRRSIGFQREHYQTRAGKGESFLTYDDGRSGDELIAIKTKYRVTLLEENKQNTSIGTFEIAQPGPFNRGMPVVNSSGDIVAIIAEQKVDKPYFEAVMISAIREKLEQYEVQTGRRCTYFNFVEAGQTINACELEAYKDERKRDSIEKERRARAQLDRKEMKEYRLSKINSWTLGPTVSYLTSSLSTSTPTSDETNLPIDKLIVGMNIYIAPDSRGLRATLKPRYTIVETSTDDNNYTPPYTNYRLDKYKYTLIEVPVVIEYVLNKDGGTGLFIGAGYTPGYQEDINFTYSTYVNLTAEQKSAVASGTKGFVHGYNAELGIDFKRIRFSFLISRQLGDFMGKDYSMMLGSSPVKPFASVKKPPLLFGIEFSYRLKGIWGIKNKVRPSQFLKQKK